MAVCGALAANSAGAADFPAFCADCQLQVGVGNTYHFWGRTGSVVVPITVVWDRDRWELGAFRMADSQGFYDATFRTKIHVGDPYWGFSLSRRWEFFQHPRWRFLVGLGGSYKTEEDRLSASLWNFAEQLGFRVIPVKGTAVELCMRHWSNGGLKLPNHGQDFATLSFTITPAAFRH